MAEWRCANCGASEGRLRRAALCEPCRAELGAQGLAWCGGCHSAQPSATTDKRRGRCRECERARWHERARTMPPRRVKRPAVVVPPLPPITHQIVRAWVALADAEWTGSFD